MDEVSWGNGVRRFRRVLPNILQGKTRGKKPCGKSPSGKPKKRERPALTKYKGWYIMKSLLVVFRGVRECLWLGGLGEEESGQKGRMVFHKLS